MSKSEDAILQFGQISNLFIKDGNALLLNTGYSKKGLGIDFTFRRMENMSFFSEREKSRNIFITQELTHMEFVERSPARNNKIQDFL